jgi:transposase
MVYEAKQFAESDRQVREVTELKNRIKGQLTSVSRSYSEYGWLLDSVDQEMVKEAVQKAKALPPDANDCSLLRELLTQLEHIASKLADAVFNTAGAQPSEAAPRAQPGDEVQQLLKSALANLDPKKP